MARNFLNAMFLGGLVAIAGCDNYIDAMPKWQKYGFKSDQEYEESLIASKKNNIKSEYKKAPLDVYPDKASLKKPNMPMKGLAKKSEPLNTIIKKDGSFSIETSIEINSGEIAKITEYKSNEAPAKPKRISDSLYQEPYWISADYWINSKPLNINDLEGKAVLLDFWATWCPACIEFLPTLEKYHNENKDVLVIGICSVDALDYSSRSNIEDIVKQHKFSFPITLDVNGKTLEKYKIKAIPAQILFDKDGKIIERK